MKTVGELIEILKEMDQTQMIHFVANCGFESIESEVEDLEIQLQEDGYTVYL